MPGELLFVLLIVTAAGIVAVFVRESKKRRGNNRKDWDRFYLDPEAGQSKPDQLNTSDEAEALTSEESSIVELKRLQKLINSRKKIALETDLSYHVWNLYKSQFRSIGPHLLNPYSHDGKWYELKTLQASTLNDVRKFEFELSGVRYKFVDDEEKQKISDNLKLFNLCLFDDSDHCLINIPMKLRVDDSGKSYSISSDSPKAFILGRWIKDFISVSLKHQSIRNQEIREQKHQERLREIKELKDKFGISE
ncbi:MAG TPA: hypothetical protein VJN01_06290 [Xanthomonadales bacterium]|nr:hypothetical protein [Xanthomonadales bacterium]